MFDNASISKALLPSGFSDLLPPEAGQETDAITLLLKTFKQFGYDRIKPPLAEFEESLFAPGPGASLMHETFRMMDPISHRMMGIRSDITAQIARIASSRLQNEPRPLRLCYANDVLRTKGSQQRTARQFTQVGCEIIGSDTVEADVEIAVVAVKALSDLGVTDLTVDLNLPRLADLVFAEYKTDDAHIYKINKALQDRDQEALSGMNDNAAKLFASILDVAGNEAQIFKTLSKHGFMKTQIKRLEDVYQGVQKALKELELAGVKITIDVLETSGLEYHRGVTFAFYTGGSHAPIGRGGRYTIAFAEEKASEESASGFTVYTDVLKNALPEKEAAKRIAVGASESWGTIKALQDEGWIVVRGCGQNKEHEGCTHKFEDGKIIEV